MHWFAENKLKAAVKLCHCHRFFMKWWRLLLDVHLWITSQNAFICEETGLKLTATLSTLIIWSCRLCGQKCTCQTNTLAHDRLSRRHVIRNSWSDLRGRPCHACHIQPLPLLSCEHRRSPNVNVGRCNSLRLCVDDNDDDHDVTLRWWKKQRP